MAESGKLKVSLSDVRGQRVQEDVDVSLRHQTLGTEQRVRLKGGKITTITDLRQQPDGVYRVAIQSSSYLPVGQFINIKSSGITPLDLTVPIDPRRVKRITPKTHDDLPEDARRLLGVSKAVLGFEGRTGAALYDGLDDIRKAGLLNIVAKTLTTRFDTGRAVLSFVQELTELRGDRFFAVVTKDLREETKNAVHSGLFESVSALLHHPPEGFSHAGSFKTADHYGNLQLTFFAKGDDWRADIDIDDANGLEHVFQVVRNGLSGRPTHPFDIHELLLQFQKLDPGYQLVI
jgi:hypothetical protein